MSRANIWAVVGGTAAGVAVGLILLLMALPLIRGKKPTPAAPAVNEPAAANLPAAANTPAAPPEIDAALARDLQQIIEEEVERLSGSPAVHVRLSTGEQAGFNADTPMPAASVIKLPLMVVLEHAWRSGTLERTGVDETRMRTMITQSDNPAANALMERVGISQVNTWLEEHGYRGTRLKHAMFAPQPEGPNTVTAAEMTRMLLEIAQGTLIDAAASAEMRRILTASERRTRIPAALPDGVTSGNKTGSLNGIVNDAAFIELPDGRTYSLAVLIDRAGADEPTSRAVARLSRRLYERIAGVEEEEAAPD
jgi:beta-lactamase class A